MENITDIFGFNGPPRSFKTAAVATLGLWYWKRGYTILSNFPFHTADKKPLPIRYRLVEPIDLLTMLKEAAEYNGHKPLYPNHVFCGQEMQSWLESRMGHDPSVLMLGYWVLYSGKMGVSIIYDTQLNSSVDKRLKENASKRFECEAVPDSNRPAGAYFWDLDLEDTEKNTRLGTKKKIPIEYFRRYVFPYYNTYKVTKPLGFDKWYATVLNQLSKY